MKIAALVSGGVDSSVTVHLLKEQGFDPTLFYIKIGMEDEHGYIDCPAEDDMAIVRILGKKYGCRVEEVSLHQEYWDHVVAYTIEQVRRGLTPNPDMMCNRMIKFGYFEEKWGHEFDYISTGHYATVLEENGKKYLGTTIDPVKDQTDFLAQITYKQLSKILFTIGKMMKSDARKIAIENNLPSAFRKDSQGICFLGKINYNDFIRRNLGEKEGKIVELETGKILGKHKGFWFLFIGQRKGLGLSGGPWYVIKKDVEENIIYVSCGFDTEKQYENRVRLNNMHFITEDPWGEFSDEKPISFKIRHTPDFTQGTIRRFGDIYEITANEKQQGVAPGQFGVIYDPEHRKCLGSGVIF